MKFCTATAVFLFIALLSTDFVLSSPTSSTYLDWVVSSKILLPKAETTNWCTFHRGPEISEKHYVAAFQVYQPKQLLDDHAHHVDIFRCTAPEGTNAKEFFEPYLTTEGYDCYNSKEYFPMEYCRSYFEWIFFMGLEDETMKSTKHGKAVGPNEFFMMLTHYGNPNEEDDLVIEAGMQFKLTNEHKDFETGHILLGSETDYTHMIPPDSSEFTISRHCSPECTKSLPHEINLISYTMHTHDAGQILKLRHFRDGVELPEIAKIDPYHPHELQNYRKLPEEVKILPGDQITLECTYNTTKVSPGKATIGGKSVKHEMCMAFIRYYPLVSELNQCGSSLSSRDLLKFLGIQEAEFDHVLDEAIVFYPEDFTGLTITDVAERLNWTPELRYKYQELVKLNHDGYCYGDFGHEIRAKNILHF